MSEEEKADRFAEIQRLWHSPDDNIDGSDIYWLISEVKRLRTENTKLGRTVDNLTTPFPG